MKKIIEFLEKHFVPIAGRIGSQKHLAAIRDGFVSIMPFLMVGSIAVLINNIPIPGWADFMKGIFGEAWNTFGGNIWNGSFAIMSLLVTFSISYHLAKSYNSDGLSAGLISFGVLLMLYAGSSKDWAIPFAYLGAQGLFVALFVSLAATEIFVRLLKNKRFVIKMPDSVPPAVARSFAALVPGAIVFVVFCVFKLIMTAVGVPDIHDAIFKLIQEPLSGLANNLGSALIIVFLIHLLWFFGLHGANILLPISTMLFLPLMEANIAAFQAGQPATNIITPPFLDGFVYMGGAGSTVCLLIALFIVAKRADNRSKARIGIGPGIFNINEPVLFGMPLVLNPIYLIPFILTPLVLTVISYLAIASGIVPHTIAMSVWTTPPILYGALSTGSIMGAVLSIINIAVGVLIYIPFVAASEKMAKDAEAKVQTNTLNA